MESGGGQNKMCEKREWAQKGEKQGGKKWTTAAKKGTLERGRVELMGKQQTIRTRRGGKQWKAGRKLKTKLCFNSVFKQAAICGSTAQQRDVAETVWEWPPAVCHAPHLLTESILPCLQYIPSVSLSFYVELTVFLFCSLFLTSPLLFPLPIPLERAPRQCLEAAILRNDGLGRGCMEAEGVAEHCSVAWLMGTCIIFLEGSASEGQNVVYRLHALKGPAARRKGHFFNGHSVTLNHDLLFLSVCISSWQRQWRILADVQAALQH